MTDLTEKWEAGELEAGSHYYVKTHLGNILIDVIDFTIPNHNGFLHDVKEVLAPVPSFEEWQDGIFNFNILIMSLNGREKRERRLKGLLKECKTRMTDCLYKLYDEGGQSYPNLDEELKSLLTKIEEVLK